ncbi:MAG: glycogen/starch/alpha-glucan phosphorylase [Polyangiaceae bacterium]|jgi:starch phosphorylase|nr:glycogen/starch/alpha-glucan phosphorylase [Polyangiaceae bacterium]MBK8943313.1 glycogen/starch/alpha-glucan phosphorylase [Polyangiaceae bacterium]
MSDTPSSLRGIDVDPKGDLEALREGFVEKLYFTLAKFPGVATRNDHYLAAAYLVRDRLLNRWIRSARSYLEGEHRTVIYLSAEYLMGPQLAHNLLNLGMTEQLRAALASLGMSLDELIEHEEEPGLGNGGLGRLAACYMDSLATLDIPAIGHGIRYEFGIFDQEIRGGWQVERTDRWLRLGNPWEIRRYEIEHPVGFGGRTEAATDAQGRFSVRWVPERIVKGVPYDTPVLGYATSNANFLRLWTAVAAEEFDLEAFQIGEYWRAVEQKIQSENITKVLYPNDASPAGKQLRLEQEYFFVSCALQDCIRLLLQRTTIDKFADKFCVQLNDTHPSLAVVELMRLLIDVHGLAWDQAWAITTKAVAYTNHTLMSEALEIWPLPLFSRLLPRHTEIVFEINRRFLDEVRSRFPGDAARLRRMSLIDERGEKHVRMANLATVAAHKVNGVAELHSRLLRETVLRDFAEMTPEKFTNVTNGVTPRRFVALSNPALAALISEAIGPGWLREGERLKELASHADDAAFRERWSKIKHDNKAELSKWLTSQWGLSLDPSSMLDAQCKRIHEYKRQHLNALHALWLLSRVRRGDTSVVPRTILFAGKAAPAYHMAKLIIRLIHGIADAIEADPVARRVLKVVFVPDFNVKSAQRIYPAAELSEQISTAGREASGTGNMKFAMNGALTIGTLDGANVEIRDAVGAESFFLFGLTADEVARWQAEGYHPGAVLQKDPGLVELLDQIEDGHASPREPGLFGPLLDDLRHKDPFFVLADFRAYIECQEAVERAYRDPGLWTRMSILNAASMGRFSSDRSIAEYAERIWRVPRVPVA